MLTRHAARYRYRVKQEGSCKSCGHEARPGRTRCFPCARRNAAYMRARLARETAEQRAARLAYFRRYHVEVRKPRECLR